MNKLRGRQSMSLVLQPTFAFAHGKRGQTSRDRHVELIRAMAHLTPALLSSGQIHQAGEQHKHG